MEPRIRSHQWANPWIFSERGRKPEILRELNLVLEQVRVLWRLVHDRRWISQQQLVHVTRLIDEAGRMAGGWLKSFSAGRRH